MSGTYISKIPVLVVALVIGIVLVTSAVVPLASDYSEAKTFKNEGYYTMDKVTDETNSVIVWERSSPEKINIDGTDFSMSFAEIGRSYTLIGSESLIVRFDKFGSNSYTINAWDTSTYFNMGNGSTVTITLTNGSVTCASDRSDIPNYSQTYSVGDDCYIINPNGTGDHAFIMKKSTVPAYLNGDSTIIFMGITQLDPNNSGIYACIYGIGSLEDGIELSTIYAPNSITTITYGEAEPTYTEDKNYIDLYLLDKYDFTINYDDSEAAATYSYFIVPAEVTADPDNPAAYKNLVKVVPLMAFIMLVVAAAGMVYLKNKD